MAAALDGHCRGTLTYRPVPLLRAATGDDDASAAQASAQGRDLCVCAPGVRETSEREGRFFAAARGVLHFRRSRRMCSAGEVRAINFLFCVGDTARIFSREDFKLGLFLLRSAA